MKVWLVSTGEYSDFRIRAAYATEELARSVAYDINGGQEWGSAEVHEFEVEQEPPHRLVVREMSINYRLMHQLHTDHFHTPDPDPFDCPQTNILRQVEPYDAKRVYFSWDGPVAAKDVDVRVTDFRPHRAEIGVWVEGTDHERVARVFYDEAAKAKARLSGVAD